MELTAFDLKLLRVLADDGRGSWTELAQQMGVTGQAVAERVRRLQQTGVIDRFTVRVNPAAMGVDTTAFVAVTLERPRYREGFLRAVAELNSILECHQVAGDDDYWLKLMVSGLAGLEEALDVIRAIPGVARTRSTMVLKTAKSGAVPWPAEPAK
jgi:Lrp/AsnC family leucine-responsive transcriptional regulator